MSDSQDLQELLELCDRLRVRLTVYQKDEDETKPPYANFRDWVEAQLKIKDLIAKLSPRG